MARVFISYRRADGQYAVGWIEERLRGLDEVTHLRTAFRDNSLRLGDDLSDRLADEVRDCDVLIAVIGPNWRGVRDDGSARIDESLDWVGREIVSALADGKRIIPVLIAGAEPLQPADLPEPLRPFADLLAVRFDAMDDLDRLERDLQQYLDELDHERARLRGLDEPIVVPQARFPAWVWFLAVAAGLIAGWVGYETLADPGGRDDAASRWYSSVEIGVWTFLFVIGVAYVHRVLADVVQVRWPTVVKTAALSAALVALTVIAFAPSADLGEVAQSVLQALLAVVLMSPWIVMMLGASWSSTRAVAIRERVEVIALHRRGLALATPVVSVVLALAVATTASVAAASLLERDANGELTDVLVPNSGGLTNGEVMSLIAFGVFLTLIILAALQFSLAGLQHDSERIRTEMSDLAPTYRQHVDAVLVTDGINVRLPLVWIALAPVATSIIAVLATRW